MAPASRSQDAALTAAFKQTLQVFAASLVALSLTMTAAPWAVAQTKAAAPVQVTVSEKRSLLFGTIAGDVNGPGTVTLNPVTGAKTVTGFVFDMGKTDRIGTFAVTGPKNAWVFLTLPNTATLTRTGGGGTMTMRSFTSSPTAGLIQLDNKGKRDIFVGATIDVATGQPKGNYTGTFTISVSAQ